LLWVAVTLVASFGAIFVVVGSWNRYDINPTVMSLEKDYRQWNTLFPAVTMCFLQNMNHTRADQEIKKYDMKKMAVFWVAAPCRPVYFPMSLAEILQ
jgi:hypothetical protein